MQLYNCQTNQNGKYILNNISIVQKKVGITELTFSNISLKDKRFLGTQNIFVLRPPNLSETRRIFNTYVLKIFRYNNSYNRKFHSYDFFHKSMRLVLNALF